MDKKFLKENNLYEAHKQFMRLCEWSYVPTTLEEEGDDEMPQDNNPQGEGDANGTTDPNTMPQGGDVPPMDGNSNQEAQGNEGMDQGGEMPMDADPNAMPQDGNIPPMDADPNAMPPMEGEDETVIDVDDITNAQEKMNDKVNVVGQELGKVDSKIEALLQTLTKMETMINNNNQEIANFKAEFAKRNPTQTEKLNLRSLDSYPFNVNPKDYWSQKGSDPNSNYSAFSNNGEPLPQEYVITNNDVDDFNEREVEQSFDIDDELKQDINKIFGL